MGDLPALADHRFDPDHHRIGRHPVKKSTNVKITSSTFHCPKGYPINGIANSGIYHVPSGSYYSRTKPEECFATESAAKNAGYRKSKL